MKGNMLLVHGVPIFAHKFRFVQRFVRLGNELCQIRLGGAGKGNPDGNGSTYLISRDKRILGNRIA